MMDEKTLDIILLIIEVIVFFALFIGYDALYACFYAIMMVIAYWISK